MTTTVAGTGSTNDCITHSSVTWQAVADGIISWGRLCSSGHWSDEGGRKVVDVRKGASTWALWPGRGPV